MLKSFDRPYLRPRGTYTYSSRTSIFNELPLVINLNLALQAGAFGFPESPAVEIFDVLVLLHIVPGILVFIFVITPLWLLVLGN